jgi:ribonuclease HI
VGIVTWGDWAWSTSFPIVAPSSSKNPEREAPLKRVTIYTDGACIGNPGPGGYGVVLLYGNHRKELSGGFRLTTNNRMELTAVIVGLQALKTRCTVTLYSDSEYVVTSMQAGLPQRWRARGWRRGKRGKALNSDLWERLLFLCSEHSVTFEWVRGHSGNPENERCDQLSQDAARQAGLPADTGYEGEDAARVASG